MGFEMMQLKLDLPLSKENKNDKNIEKKFRRKYVIFSAYTYEVSLKEEKKMFE